MDTSEVTDSSEAEAYLAEARSVSLEALAALPIDEDRVLWRTTQALVERCMAEDGFSYPVEAYPGGVGNLDAIGRYPDADLVARYGYLWADHRTDGVPPQPPSAAIEDPQFQRQLGVCFSEADAAIGRADLEQALAPLYDAAAEMSVAVNSEPEVVQAIEEWIDCMSQRGYRVTDLRAAEDLASNGGTVSMTSPYAVEVAVADFECQRTVGLLEAQLSARRRLVANWIEANPTALRNRDDAVEVVVRRCLDLVPG